MGLPIQTTPTYRCVLPSSGREVKYRPFLVKEQKILSIAKESEDQKQIFNAIKDLIESVTFGEVLADNLAVMDLEYLFLKTRSASVGETTTVNTSCSDTDCGGSATLKINLDEIEPKGESADNKVMINDNVGVTLRPPVVKNIKSLGSGEDADVVEILTACIDSIFDEENVYMADETSDKDLLEFVESLTFGQLEQLSIWFESLPKLTYTTSGACEVCGKETTRTLEGLQSFF